MARPRRRPLRLLLLALLLPIACSGGGSGVGIDVERPSPATRGDRLDEAVGIETAAGVFTPLLERGCPLPCEATARFGTAEEGQQEILIFVFRGSGSDVASATALGTFEISGFPPATGEGPEIAVTFRADADGISLRAEESSGLPIRLNRL